MDQLIKVDEKNVKTSVGNIIHVSYISYIETCSCVKVGNQKILMVSNIE